MSEVCVFRCSASSAADDVEPKLLANWLRIKWHRPTPPRPTPHRAEFVSLFIFLFFHSFFFFLAKFCCFFYYYGLFFGFVFAFSCQKLIRLIKTLAGSAMRCELQVQSYFSQVIEWKLYHLPKREPNAQRKWETDRDKEIGQVELQPEAGEQN